MTPNTKDPRTIDIGRKLLDAVRVAAERASNDHGGR